VQVSIDPPSCPHPPLPNHTHSQEASTPRNPHACAGPLRPPQILLFGILSIEIKRKAPHAHTVCEIIRARYVSFITL
jgi:hypothetical protein